MENALQITQLLTNIVVILLFLGIFIVLIALIKSVKKISQKFDAFSSDFSDIKPKIMETVNKVNFLADNLSKVVTNVNDNVEVLGTVVEKIKDTADNIIEFEQKIQNTIEPPVMDTLNTVTAVSVGVKTFFDSWKKNKSGNSAHLPESEDDVNNKINFSED